MNRNLVEWNTGGIRPVIFEKISLDKKSENLIPINNIRLTADSVRNDSRMMGKSHA